MGNEPSSHASHLAELEEALKRDKVTHAEQIRHGWSEEKHPDNIVLSEDSLVARRGPEKRLVQGVRGKVGYTSGVHAFKFTWKPSVKKHLCVGLVSPRTKLSGNGMVLGSDNQSIGWDLISKEIIFNGIPDKRYPTKDQAVPDTLLMLLNMDEGVLAFKSMTQDFGVAFRGLKRVGSTFHVAAALGAPGDEVKLEYVGSIANVKLDEKMSSTALVFSTTCGSNVVLTNNNRKAHRKNPLDTCDHATVFTNRPLIDGEMLHVKVEETVRGKWNACFRLGATTNPPEKVRLGTDMEACDSGIVWTFSGNRILRNTKFVDEFNGDLNDTKVGDTAAIKLEKHYLKFYMNDYQQISVRIDSIEPVYGYIDIYGNTSCLSLVAMDHKEEHESEMENMIRKSRWGHDMPETVSEYLRVLETGLSMMKAKSTECIQDVYQLVRCLNKVQMKGLINRQRIQAADTLAHQNGAEIIADYLLFLRSNLHIHSYAVQCYPLLMDFCFNNSDHSILLCKKVAMTSLFEACINYMGKYKDGYQESERAGRLIKAGLGILHNCAKVPENKLLFQQHRFMHIAKDYVLPDKNPTWACMQALFAMSYIHKDSEISLLGVPAKVLDTMSKCLKNGLKEDNNHEFGGWTACELVAAISNLAVNLDNVEAFMEHGIAEHLVTMMAVGSDYEKECALNAMWNLITDQTKVILTQVKNFQDFLDNLIEDRNVDVNQAAIRVKVKLQAGNILLSNGFPLNTGEQPLCDYMKTCVRFVETLGLSEFFFSKEYDLCYCAVCHGHRAGKLKYIRGNPPKAYGVPIGWCRFGLSPPPKAKALDVFSNWHRAYHGTKKEYIKGILEVGELVPAGRDVMGGVRIKEQNGHFNDRNKPFLFDTKQIFLSPSIRYSSGGAYATPSSFFDPVTNRTYGSKVVLQVLIKPDSYTVGPETTGARGEIDPSFSNQELEWSTKQQGSTVLYGLLINLH